MEKFTKNIKFKEINALSIEQLEYVVGKFPYFHLAKTFLLKKYYQQKHFKYNYALKNLAAHTHHREVLFDFVNQIAENKKLTLFPMNNQLLITEITNESKAVEVTEKNKSIDEIVEDKPFAFNKFEKHSFNQWLQIKEMKPIERNPDTFKKGSLNAQLHIVNQFLENNPKITPIKKIGSLPNQAIKNTSSNISNELMTETLAKVYVDQKKYGNAIQAYRVLSLKYPEKSSLFADQIQRIKILQTHK